MIQPVNGHLLIEPLAHEQYISSTKGSYEEIGVVLAISGEMKIRVPTMGEGYDFAVPINVGDKVYFDSWLAARYPSDNPDKPYWLVKWEDVRAIDNS